LDSATGSGPRPVADERLVARLWDAQHPFSLPLKTTAGDEIRIVYRGRRRYDHGPDFPGALIAMQDESLVLGDVEIHVRSSDWRRHGHHRDNWYNNVVLHVVLWDDGEPCLREDGVPVPLVELASHLSHPLESLLAHGESDAPRPAPCWRGDLERNGELGAILDQCGIARFDARARRYEAELNCCSEDQLLYRGIAIALGYSQNRQPFEKLAELLPLKSAVAYRVSGREAEGVRWGKGERLEALMLGAAGLLPFQRGIPSESGSYTRDLEERWAEAAPWVGTSMQPAEWQFFRVRPNNFPPRRVAALARLLSCWPTEGLAETIVDLAQSLEPRQLPRALEALLLGAPRDGYWALHCDFGLPLRRPTDLVGRQRSAEIAVNVFLPFLAARAAVSTREELGTCAREAYRLYPKRGDNEIARYVAVQVTGVPRPPVARSACRQQGLLQIYRTWCEVKRCAECSCGARDGMASASATNPRIRI
jgi:hypothetical protein